MYKVLIRPLEINDASVSWKWRNDPEIWKYTGNRPTITVTKEIEEKWLKDKLNESNSSRFAITVDDVYIGNIQLTDIIPNQSGQYHIFIGNKEFWGKGIGTIATAQILQYAKYVLNLKEVFLFVNPLNKSAIKVYEKSGFKIETSEIKMSIDLNMVNAPKASVFMLAYNHEAYIEQAIQSVLMQKTSFDFDIVIGEDCSTDNTRHIIRKIAQKYPGKFKLLLHSNNIGAMANQIETFRACTGKYIAMLEGDDYWIDPLKLQKQIDFLEENKDYGLVHSDFNTYYQDSNYTLVNTHSTHKIKLEGNCSHEYWNQFGKAMATIKTLTVCFRNNWVKEWEKINAKKYENWSIGDFPLYFFISLHSKIGYLNTPTAVYRTVPMGSASNVGKNYSKILLSRKSYVDIRLFMLEEFSLNGDLYIKALIRDINILLQYCILDNDRETLIKYLQIKNIYRNDYILDNYFKFSLINNPNAIKFLHTNISKYIIIISNLVRKSQNIKFLISAINRKITTNV